LAGVFGLDGGPHFGVGLFNQKIAVVHGGSLSNEGPWRGQWLRPGCPGERLNT